MCLFFNDFDSRDLFDFQFTNVHEIRIGKEFRRMSNEESETPIVGSDVFESSKQIAGPEFPLHETQADHHSVQNAELGKLRDQSVVLQYRD